MVEYAVPQVIEAYKDYTPPRFVLRTVETLIRSVPRNYLVGLKTVVLTNYGALSHDDRRNKLRSRGHQVPMPEVLGTYHQLWKGNPAWIQIFVDHIVNGLPRTLLWIPLFRYGFFAKVLYHELGHHIHKTIRPEYGEREDTADAWERKLSRRFLRTRYWYLLPVLYPLGMALRFTKNHLIRIPRGVLRKLRGGVKSTR